MKREGIDAIIGPTHSTTAFNIGAGSSSAHFAKFTMLFNFLDFPSGSVPVGLAGKSTMKPIFNDIHYKLFNEGVKDCEGMPVSVQVATMTNDDEMCIRLMKEIDDIYQFNLNHSTKVFDRLKNFKKTLKKD